MDSVPDLRETADDRPGDRLTPVLLHPEQASRPATRLALGVLVVVFSGIFTLAFLHIYWFLSRDPLQLSSAAAYMLALLGLQLGYFSRPGLQPRPPVSYLALLAQAALLYLPMLQFKDSWVGLPGFLAGSLLLALRPRAAWPLFGLTVASLGLAQYLLTGYFIDVVYTLINTMITGLIVYGLTRLASLVKQLHLARTELAQMAVAQERLRFARDLHDLLGYSLSAITLKSELTHRLVIKQPEKAQEELSEVLDISRRALADVRSVASGYRELSLDAEAQSARSVLEAADVDVHMDIDYGHLPVLVGTLLATVLREGVTNMLRHSKAEWCEITVRQGGGQVQMDIVNDGVPECRNQPTRNGGSGVQNLSARVALMGGRLTAGAGTDGRYRLHVTVPVNRT